jgi:hypothetical protein
MSDVIIPAQGEFGCDIATGDGKLGNLFFMVQYLDNCVTKLDTEGSEHPSQAYNCHAFLFNAQRSLDCRLKASPRGTQPFPISPTNKDNCLIPLSSFL